MDEDNSPRKKPWIQRLLKQSCSELHLVAERPDIDQSSLLSSGSGSHRGSSRFGAKYLRKATGEHFTQQYPNPDSETMVPSPIQITQHPSPLVASTLNAAQSSSSGIAKMESLPDVTHVSETLADTQTGVAGIVPTSGIEQTTASATDNLQSVSDSETLRQFSEMLGILKTFHAVVDEIANLHPYAKVALGILTQASKMIIDQAQPDDAVFDLLSKVCDVYALVTERKALAKISSMTKVYTKIARQTLKCAEFMVHYSKNQKFEKQLLTNIFRGTNAEIHSHSDALDGLMQQFRDHVARDTVSILQGLSEGQDLSGMEYAAGAGLNTSKCCLPDTRGELLSDIKSWIGSTGEDVPRILWLSGMAGKGKSAIAHTIANWSDDLGGLGACFCFDHTRGADRRHEKIFFTIARDLADCNPTVREALACALHDNNKLKHSADIARQWQELVVGPVRTAWNDQDVAAPILIVIDALCESGDPESRKQILRLLAGKLRTSSSQLTDLPASFRVLITSRLLEDIHNILGSTPNVRHISMDDIPIASTERDIFLYISDELHDLRHVLNDRHVKMLAKKSDGLFEWARLACVYITGMNKVGVDPIDRCQAVLAGTSTSRTGTHLLDHMCRCILGDLMPEDEIEIARFRSVMAQVVASFEPLSMTALIAMRQDYPIETDRYIVEQVITPMGSLLTGTTDLQTLIRPLHPSFYDFLTDESRSCEFFVDVSSAQSNLAFSSLRIMKRGLRFNICSLENSYLPNSSIPDLEKRVKESIPAELSYSCRFWGAHVGFTPFNLSLAKEIEAFFDGERLLFWLEALALMKNLGDSIVTLLSVANWFSGHTEFAHVSDATRDTLRFVRSFATTILRSTPHLYLSALPFAPIQSRMFCKFAGKFPCTPRIVAGHVVNWPQIEKILHTNVAVYSVAMSSDGKRIACGLHNKTIQVWDMEIGEALYAPLQGHTDRVVSVAFSLNGHRIVSGSWDCTVRVWDAKTGEASGSPLQGHTDSVLCIAISLDGKSIVSGSADKSIRVWNEETGELVVSFEGHADHIRSVAISPDKKWIVSGSDDRKIRVWDTGTGEARSRSGHSYRVQSVAFSPEGHPITVASRDINTFQVWNMRTHESLSPPLRGYTGDILSVAISLNGRIVCGSQDQTIRVWNIGTGEPLGVSLQGHTAPVNALAISPDGDCIVSGSDDCTVRVWDMKTYKAVGPPFRGHTGRILSVAISPDGKRIVSGSEDKTIRVWDLDFLNRHQPPEAPAICVSSDPTRVLHSSVSFLQGSDSEISAPSHTNEDGWIVGPEGRLLFCVPLALYSGAMHDLYAPGKTLVIPNNIPQLDLSRVAHGTSWHECRGQ